VKYKFQYDGEFHNFLRVILFKSPWEILEYEWGIVEDTASMFTGTSSMDLIPLPEGYSFQEGQTYITKCNGEVLAQRAMLVFMHEETEVHRLNGNVHLGYDTSLFIMASRVIVETESEDFSKCFS
jgi:hypothetical protein